MLRRLRRLSSPLEVRSSLSRIRHKCSGRRKLLWQLLYPRPWHFEAKPLPPTHDVLMAKAKAAEPLASTSRVVVVRSDSLLQRNIRQLQNIPLFRLRDTPLWSLYRLYEDLCSGEIILMGYESDYFFAHNEASWRLSQIPDPKDADVVRYAVLASFVEALVAAFNWKIEEGLRRNGKHAFKVEDQADYPRFLETAPSWTSRVVPLAETIDLRLPSNKDGVNEIFQKRNIVATMGYLYCV
ncbi:hypothetical protein BB8028_0001g04770 [Beauveria bassiana]|uniref:Uncharacterized protein n=1 Tax=Beauveria bassiana TaxID=176275 RepID=A0A2S7XWW3_BEABA|nr:hypothetical protein BB8028_0001g04770 [Beauveria bassiana]